MNIIQIPAFTDNYFWLMFEDNNKSAVVVDPGDSAPVIKSLKDNNLELTDILITHHHNDHIGGVSELKKVFPRVNIFGPADPRIPADNIVKDEDVIKLDSLNEEFRVLDVRGHTNSHIAYYFDKKLFCGDTLFSCGCGRLFEGTHEDMHKALTKIKNLPKETLIYCAHEYTLDNIGFAKIIDPKNLDLLEREKEVKDLLKNGFYTIPSALENELKVNPFLRFDEKDIKNSVQNHFNKKISSDAQVFKYTREWKDNEYD
ncbi:hydroxyacylglutathione hydrolase [Gammaproteobacteria bacterium]|nr:hydroxyacylglutathione hydrolase [Gammaproteobacteria bacterium]|tara:strand:+ start:469 stop:1242 length:774 start_codon:yes stop_codon:yes gene_type:complete